jgi:hypothetical protein
MATFLMPFLAKKSITSKAASAIFPLTLLTATSLGARSKNTIGIPYFSNSLN